VPAPPADCRNKSVEEIINGWKKSLESDCAAFQLQAEKLRSWENEIRSSQAEIVEVSSYAEKLVISQQRTEKVLTEVRAYQDDLDADLDAMERHVDDLFARSATRPPLDADVEREHAYDLSVKLENQLGAMLDQLKDLVVKLNVQHDSALGEEPARDIMKIVNAHHQSLAYLNAKAQKMDADVSALEADVEQLRRQAPP
jgi:nuclear pore complex protein Nup62